MSGDAPALDVGPRHDRHPLEPAEVGQQVGGGFVDGDAHGRGVDGGDIGDGGELVEIGQFLVDDPAVGVDDVVGGERRPVVEGDAAPEVERPHPLIRADLPALGERRAHLEIGVGFDQGVEDVFEHLEREVRAGLMWVELVGFTRDRGDQIARRGVAEVDAFPRGTARDRQQQRHGEGHTGREHRTTPHQPTT